MFRFLRLGLEKEMYCYLSIFIDMKQYLKNIYILYKNIFKKYNSTIYILENIYYLIDLNYL